MLMGRHSGWLGGTPSFHSPQRPAAKSWRDALYQMTRGTRKTYCRSNLSSQTSWCEHVKSPPVRKAQQGLSRRADLADVTHHKNLWRSFLTFMNDTLLPAVELFSPARLLAIIKMSNVKLFTLASSALLRFACAVIPPLPPDELLCFLTKISLAVSRKQAERTSNRDLRD